MFFVAWLLPPEWMRENGFRWSFGEFTAALLFWWLVMVFPVAISGLLHQMIIALLPRGWPRELVYAVTILTTAVIPLALAVVSPNPALVLAPRVLVPTIMVMCGYGCLVSMTEKRTAEGNDAHRTRLSAEG